MSQESQRECGLCPALFSLGLAILAWASVPLLLKSFTQRLDAWTVNGLRYAFAALFWLPFVLRHRREVPPGRHIWRDAVPPACVHLFGQILFSLTPYFNDATVINFVSRSSFLFVSLFGFALLRDERPLARQPMFWIGTAAVAAGLLAMYRGGVGTASTSTLGMIILLGTSVFWGLYSVTVRKCMKGYSARLSFGVISLYPAPALLALMFLVGDWRPILHIGLWWWFLIWVSAVAGIALGHVFFFRGIHAIGPIASEGSLLLIPFLTSVLAYFTLGERLTRVQWIGGLALVLGCAFLLAAKARLHLREEMAPSTTD